MFRQSARAEEKILRESPSDDDPFLSPREMADDAGISLSTWWRTWRKRLPVVRIGKRKIGVRRSDWSAALDSTLTSEGYHG